MRSSDLSSAVCSSDLFFKGTHMARVTVEDCVDKVTNRFDLVLLAAQRAREVSGGAELTIDRDRDKNPVVALREIAEETITPADLKESLISGLRSEEHTSELQSIMRISYSGFCIKK